MISLLEKNSTPICVDFLEHWGLPWLMGGGGGSRPAVGPYTSICLLFVRERQSGQCTARVFLSLLFIKVHAVMILGFIPWLQFLLVELSHVSSTSLLWGMYELFEWNNSG